MTVLIYGLKNDMDSHVDRYGRVSYSILAMASRQEEVEVTEQQKRKELHEALDRVLDSKESGFSFDPEFAPYEAGVVDGFDEGFIRGFAKGKAVGSLKMRETLNGSIRGLKEWTAREREAEELMMEVSEGEFQGIHGLRLAYGEDGDHDA